MISKEEEAIYRQVIMENPDKGKDRLHKEHGIPYGVAQRLRREFIGGKVKPTNGGAVRFGVDKEPIPEHKEEIAVMNLNQFKSAYDLRTKINKGMKEVVKDGFILSEDFRKYLDIKPDVWKKLESHSEMTKFQIEIHGKRYWASEESQTKAKEEFLIL